MTTTQTAQRTFQIGDRVRVRSRCGGGQGSVWTIDADDTDQTPVHDPEPAYRLRGPGDHRRYAYAHDLELVERGLVVAHQPIGAEEKD